MDDKSVESMLTGKHQGVRSYYQLFQQVKSRRVELSTNVNTLLTTLLELDNVRDIRSAPVVNAFHKFKEILDSLQAAQDEASRDLYILYFHPTAAGETLYKQLKSTTALQKLGVGDDMLEHKGTSELLDTAVKAVEKAKKEKENKRTRKIKKMLRCPVVVVTSPRPSGKTTGVEDVDVEVLDAVMVGRLLIPFRLRLTRGGMEVAVATPSMLLDHLRTTMADNFHPSRDVVEVPLEVVLRDILTHTHQSVYLTVVSDGIVSIY
jgi:hypothetical protein